VDWTKCFGIKQDLFFGWFLKVRVYLPDSVDMLCGYCKVLLLMNFGRDRVLEDSADVEWRCLSIWLSRTIDLKDR
jgi:hypothetical protein